jgi:hypothetical protein
MERECLGAIWRVCDTMAQFAEACDTEAVRTWYGFLKAHMRRLEIIRAMAK